jgi:hypothetical protein
MKRVFSGIVKTLTLAMLIPMIAALIVVIHRLARRGLSGRATRAQVRAWCSAQELPFPTFTADYRNKTRNTLDYPPEGAPEASA